MKKVLTVLTVLSLGLTLSAPVQANADDKVKMACEAKWGTDYKMIQYCINKQTKAVSELLKYLAMKDDVVNDIVISCAEQWKEDYQMLHYCTKKQYNAYKELN